MHLMADGYARYGEVFTVPVLHKKFTFLLGPHVSGHFFKANDEEMSQKEVRTDAPLHMPDKGLSWGCTVECELLHAGVPIQCPHIWKGGGV